MTLVELEEELLSATDKYLMISLLDTILRKAFGAKKLDFMKQLVTLYKETRANAEFLELAPSVLKQDSSDYELRLDLIKMLMGNPESILLAQTEIHRLEAQLKLKFRG